MTSQRTRDYELVMVLTPEASDEEAAAAVERVAEYITEHGGSVSEQEGWGVRRLAYPIRRYQEGNYMLTQFQLDSKEVGELGRRLNASQDVLTHLVTKVDKSAK